MNIPSLPISHNVNHSISCCWKILEMIKSNLLFYLLKSTVWNLIKVKFDAENLGVWIQANLIIFSIWWSLRDFCAHLVDVCFLSGWAVSSTNLLYIWISRRSSVAITLHFISLSTGLKSLNCREWCAVRRKHTDSTQRKWTEMVICRTGRRQFQSGSRVDNMPPSSSAANGGH